jgi:elongation factor G
MAFRVAAQYAFRSFFPKAKPQVLEPIMKVEVEVPTEFQGSAVAGIGRRRGLILGSDSNERSCVVRAEVPLASMFGYSTDLRSSTEGKGEFSMDYLKHQPVQRDTQNQLVAEYQKKRAEANK